MRAKTPIKIIFMGSAGFSMPALQGLYGQGDLCKITDIFTQPPRPKGRGQKLTKTIIHEFGNTYNIPCHTPLSLKSGEAEEILMKSKPDLIVVVAYGLLLPDFILNHAPMGAVNLHPSDLPKWRGAAPLQRSIEAGDKDTAICLTKMVKALDAGPILAKEAYTIKADETAQELGDVLAHKGADLLISWIKDYISTGNTSLLIGTPQDDEKASYAHKITKEEITIDWQESAEEIYNRFRGFQPWPSLRFSYLEGKQNKFAKINQMALANDKYKTKTAMFGSKPGDVLSTDPLIIACSHGALNIKELTPAGKAKISGPSFIASNKVVIK